MQNTTGRASQSIAELSQTMQEPIKSKTAWKIMFSDYCLVFFFKQEIQFSLSTLLLYAGCFGIKASV